MFYVAAAFDPSSFPWWCKQLCKDTESWPNTFPFFACWVGSMDGRLNLGWKHHPSLEIDFTVGSLLGDAYPPFSFGATIQSDWWSPPIFWTLIGAKTIYL